MKQGNPHTSPSNTTHRQPADFFVGKNKLEICNLSQNLVESNLGFQRGLILQPHGLTPALSTDNEVKTSASTQVKHEPKICATRIAVEYEAPKCR
jgi:hypothetical protein